MIYVDVNDFCGSFKSAQYRKTIGKQAKKDGAFPKKSGFIVLPTTTRSTSIEILSQ